jgi:hypothetical protein
MIFTKENLTDMLRNNVITVTFTKVNGEERVMRCTLMSEYVPNAPSNNGQVLIQESESKAVSVWDMEANGWRSFRVDSVKNISMG